MILDFFIATIIKLFGAIIEIGTQLFISNQSSEEIFGTVNFYFATATMIYFLFFGGRVKLIIKNISTGKSLKRFNKTFIKYYFIPIIIVFSVYLLINQEVTSVIVISIALLLAWFFEYNSYLFAKEKRVLATLENYLILRAFILIAVVVLTFIFDFSVNVILFGYLIAHLLTVIIQRFYIGRAQIKQESDVENKGLVKQYGFYQGISFLQNTFTNIPKIISFILGGAISTALFSIGLIIKQLLYFISGPTSKIFFSSFAKDFHDENYKGLRYNYQNATRWQVFFTFPLIIFILFEYPFILNLFGEGYSGAAIIVIIIALTSALEIGLGPTSNLLQMIGEERAELRNYILSLASMIIVTLLIHFFGNKEYALIIGFAVSSVVVNFLRYGLVFKKTKFLPYQARDFIYIIIMNLATIATIFFANKVIDSPLVSLVVTGLFIGLQFLLSSNKYDRNEIKKIINQVLKRNTEGE